MGCITHKSVTEHSNTIDLHTIAVSLLKNKHSMVNPSTVRWHYGLRPILEVSSYLEFSGSYEKKT